MVQVGALGSPRRDWPLSGLGEVALPSPLHPQPGLLNSASLGGAPQEDGGLRVPSPCT